MARRKLVIHGALLVVVLVALASFAALWVDLNRATATYGIEQIAPSDGVLCPGDTLTYKVSARTETVPAVLEIVETWCETGETGLCSIRLTTVNHLAVAGYRDVMTIARKVIPNDPFFKPGKSYELHHVAKNGTESAYVVPFQIGAACAEDGTQGGSGGN